MPCLCVMINYFISLDFQVKMNFHQDYFLSFVMEIVNQLQCKHISSQIFSEKWQSEDLICSLVNLFKFFQVTYESVWSASCLKVLFRLFTQVEYYSQLNFHVTLLVKFCTILPKLTNFVKILNGPKQFIQMGHHNQKHIVFQRKQENKRTYTSSVIAKMAPHLATVPKVAHAGIHNLEPMP